jgi:mRNA interferase HicA
LKGSEFERRVKRLARKRDVECHFDRAHGKGSHGRLYFGTAFTTLKDRKKEIGPGLLKSMCADLGIDPEEL